MHILLVHIQVKPEFVDQFHVATLENARNSVQEPGVARFDVLQQTDDPTRFVLVEVYHAKEAHAQHRETAHFATWRDTVAEMMAAERTRSEYVNLFPDEAGW
jgi:quinol monooxygenase YgiN